MATRAFVDGEEVGPGGAQGPIIDGEFRDVSDAAPPERPPRPRQGKLSE
jgi:hypothetical protein